MKRLVLLIILALTLIGATAFAQTIGGGAAGAGTSCNPDRIVKAVVKLPRGQVLVLRHPVKHTRIFYGDRRLDFDLYANRHAAHTESDRPLGWGAKCE
jgi:hypothetical protein